MIRLALICWVCAGLSMITAAGIEHGLSAMFVTSAVWFVISAVISILHVPFQ